MAILAIVCPALAALVGLIFGHLVPVWHGGNVLTRNGGVAAAAAVLGTAAATVLTAVLAIDQWLNPHPHHETLTTIPTGSVPIGVSLHVDGLAAVVALLVCCISLAVQVYSTAAQRDDAHFPSYVSLVGLLTAATLLVVLSGDLVVLFVGWLVMSACTFLLLNRDNTRVAAKAYVTAGIGNVALGIGVLVLGTGAHTFAIPTSAVGPHAVAGTLLVLVGVVAACALFPFQAWLPDAAALGGARSALTQGASAAAGVYVVARLAPAFAASRATLVVLAVVAVISMLAGALAALTQDDLRRLLAYVTVSQLSIALAGLAVGTTDGAILQVLAHGVTVAALVLGAGCAGTGLLSHMGGLRHRLPVTFVVMTGAFGVLAGLPPGSTFFGVNVIATQAWRAATNGRLPTGVAWLVLIALFATVAITATTAVRAWLLMFFAEPRDADTRPGGGLLRWPPAPLAGLGVVAGLVGLSWSGLRPDYGFVIVTVLLVAAVVAGIFLIWNEDPARDPTWRLRRARPIFRDGFYVDDVTVAGVLGGVAHAARGVLGVDRRLTGVLESFARLVDRTARAVARVVAGWALVVYGLAMWVGDRTVAPAWRWSRHRLEGGDPRFYLSAAALMAAAVIVLLVSVVLT